MSAAKGIQKAGDNIVSSFLANPRSLIYTAIAITVLVVAIRIMRKDKRKTKAEVKRMEQEVRLIEMKDKKVYSQAANAFDIDERSVRICDQVAFAVAGAFGRGLLGNDNEEIIIRELNRLAGPKTIKCADYFFKKYSHKTYPNIAFDSMSTLNRMEWAKIKDTLKDHLLAYARLKGEPQFDIYF